MPFLWQGKERSLKRRVQIFAAMLQPHSVSRNAAWDMPTTGVTPKSHVCPKPMDLHLQVSWSWNIKLYFVCSKVCLDWRSWSWSFLQEVQLGWHQCNVCPNVCPTTDKVKRILSCAWKRIKEVLGMEPLSNSNYWRTSVLDITTWSNTCTKPRTKLWFLWR